MLKRVVIPELLDHLPAEDPEAVRSRLDLRRINLLMGNERWICRTIGRFAAAVANGIIEIGAGDGQLSSKLARQFPQATLAAYDIAPRPVNLESRVIWRQGDIFEIPVPERCGVLVANLFLHHFEKDALAMFGRWCENCDVLIFNEPDRARLPHLLGSIIHPVINRVTRHDMHVSIRAGFTKGEITRLLGLNSSRWKIRETSTWRGARRVVACRR